MDWRRAGMSSPASSVNGSGNSRRRCCINGYRSNSPGSNTGSSSSTRSNSTSSSDSASGINRRCSIIMRRLAPLKTFWYITALYILITKVTAITTQGAMVIICHLCFTWSLTVFLDDLEQKMYVRLQIQVRLNYKAMRHTGMMCQSAGHVGLWYTLRVCNYNC